MSESTKGPPDAPPPRRAVQSEKLVQQREHQTEESDAFDQGREDDRGRLDRPRSFRLARDTLRGGCSDPTDPYTAADDRESDTDAGTEKAEVVLRRLRVELPAAS